MNFSFNSTSLHFVFTKTFNNRKSSSTSLAIDMKNQHDPMYKQVVGTVESVVHMAANELNRRNNKYPCGVRQSKGILEKRVVCNMTNSKIGTNFQLAFKTLHHLNILKWVFTQTQIVVINHWRNHWWYWGSKNRRFDYGKVKPFWK